VIPTALLFSRYRAFSESTRLDIAPLTIIVGRNGSGKSVLTRLPLLLASGLELTAEAPIDLTAGGVYHAARFEDVIYQRSAQPFSIGAEISDGHQTFRFLTTLRHVVETHSLAIEGFDLFESEKRVANLKLARPEDLGKPDGQFVGTFGEDATERTVHLTTVGLFPVRVEGDTERSGQLAHVRDLFAKAFIPVSYLGPFRAEQGSIPRIPRQGVRDLGPRGERALDIVGDDRLRGDGLLVEEVEDWFETYMGGNRVKLQLAGDIPRMLVHDPIRDVDVDISETGAGFAQVFPIVVQAFATRSSRLGSHLVIVEQPELHLHPGAHGDVADLIIDTVLECHGRVRYICETHSEQFITRVRRRIAEAKISASEVKIGSVGHQSDLGDVPQPLRMINFDGLGSPDSWPAGVFDEAFDDLVHLREAGQQRLSEQVRAE
jgi:predicted ATPase